MKYSNTIANKRFNRLVTLFLLCLLAPQLQAQLEPTNNSPYSRLGIGDLANPHIGKINGMAGTAAAWKSAYQPNLTNPASYAHLGITAFDVGLYGQYSWLESNTTDELVRDGNLSYLSLAFPVLNPINQLLERERRPISWGMGIALLPYSTVGYDLLLEDVTQDQDTILNLFQGQGGTYRLAWSNGVKYKNLALGINLNFLFGSITNEISTSFPDLTGAYITRVSEDLSFKGVLWDLGLMYTWQFKEKDKEGNWKPNGKYINFGAYGSGQNSFSLEQSQLVTRVPPLSSADVDTVSFSENVAGDGELPVKLGLGIEAGFDNHWKLASSIEYNGWEDYQNDFRTSESLTNTMRWSIGGEFIPDHDSYNKYWKKMHYQLGFLYEQDPREDVTNQQLTRSALTAGIGFPIIMKQSQGRYGAILNLSFELGRFGADSSLKENYARMNVNFTFNDNTWFRKRKFN